MQNFACVSHRRTRLGFFLGVIMLNKGANVCWCLISSKAQACGYAYVFRHMQNHCWLLCCIVCLLGIAIPGSPFVCNALKIWEVQNFPLDFLGQVRNIPLRKNPVQNPPPPPPR